MRFNNYIVEEKEKIKVIALTSHLENGDEEDTYESVKRIQEECEKKKIKCFVIFAEEGYIERDDNNIPRIFDLNNKNGIILDKSNTVVFIRGNISKSKVCMDLISQVERHEVFCINNRSTIEECADKYRTILTLANADISTPKTSIITNEHGIKVAFEKVGDMFPVVLKTLSGSKGIGVFTANDWSTLKSTLQTIWKIDPSVEILIQEYIENDYDIRIHVVGNDVIAAMKRLKIKNDFRSNYSLGGKTEKIKLTDEQIEMAIRANKAVNGIWTGVDMMMGKDGPIIIEVNSSPGIKGIEKTTNKNVVGKVIDYVENKDIWIKKTIECGFIEKLIIKGLGELNAKMDTGNGSYCIIHSDKWKIKDDKVIWKFHNKEYTHDLEDIKKIRMGALKDRVEERPVILLDVELYGTIYKDIRFTLSNRDGYFGDVLMNRDFIRKANLVINPAKRHMLAVDVVKEEKEIKEPDKEPEKIDSEKPTEDNVEDAIIKQELDKNVLSDFKKEFDDDTKKEVKEMMDEILNALDAEFHYGRPEKGSFGWKTEERIAMYVFDALKKGERNVDKLGELVHRGWSEVTNEHYKDGDKDEQD